MSKILVFQWYPVLGGVSWKYRYLLTNIVGIEITETKTERGKQTFDTVMKELGGSVISEGMVREWFMKKSILSEFYDRGKVRLAPFHENN